MRGPQGYNSNATVVGSIFNEKNKEAFNIFSFTHHPEYSTGKQRVRKPSFKTLHLPEIETLHFHISPRKKEIKISDLNFGGKWSMECLNTRSLLPTLLCARYSVKLI